MGNTTIRATRIHHVFVQWGMCMQTSPCDHYVEVVLKDGSLISLGNQSLPVIMRLMAAAHDFAPNNAWCHARYLWEDSHREDLMDMVRRHKNQEPFYFSEERVKFIYDGPGAPIVKPADPTDAGASVDLNIGDDLSKFMDEMGKMA